MAVFTKHTGSKQNSACIMELGVGVEVGVGVGSAAPAPRGRYSAPPSEKPHVFFLPHDYFLPPSGASVIWLPDGLKP